MLARHQCSLHEIQCRVADRLMRWRIDVRVFIAYYKGRPFVDLPFANTSRWTETKRAKIGPPTTVT